MEHRIEKSLLQYGLILGIGYQLYQSLFDAIVVPGSTATSVNIIITIFLILLLLLLRFRNSTNVVAVLLHILLLPAFAYFWYYNGGVNGIVPYILCAYVGFIIATTNGLWLWISGTSYCALLLVFVFQPDLLAAFDTSALNLSYKPLDYVIVGFIITLFTVYMKNTYLHYRREVALKNQQLVQIERRLVQLNGELRSHEEEITVFNENLEGMIVEQTKNIEAKHRELAEYAFINAHLVRGPLSRIMGILYLMEDDPHHFNKEDVNRLKTIANNLDGVVRQINDVLH
jgi:signal transduction histidine kinase